MINTIVSNYDIMCAQSRVLFLRYDQQKMIEKFLLKSDEDYLYIEFVGKNYRINRKSGAVERSDDGFSTVIPGDFNEAMSIYDVLCYSKEGCRLSGRFCTPNSLHGTVKSSSSGINIFQKKARSFGGKLEKLEKACGLLGKKINISGDVAVSIDAFPFLPVTFQFWDADDEFPANMKFMFDENVLDFLHYETLYYVMEHILERMEILM